MRDKIQTDLVSSMKNGDKEKLSVLRMVKGAIQLEEINLKRNLTDDEVIGVIAKQIKTRKESIIDFEKGKRDDLVSKTKSEIEILSSYMPEQLSIEEIKNEIEKVFIEVNPTSTSDMGKIMGKLQSLKGKTDMSEVSKIVKEKLSNI